MSSRIEPDQTGVPAVAARSTVLVTGATGVVGPILVRRLVEAGCEVRAIARRVPPAGTLPPTVRFWRADLTEGPPPDAIEGVEVVYHLAALLHSPDAGADEYRRANVHATRRLADAAAEAGAARVVLFSTIGVYGSGRGLDMLDETAAVQPETAYAASKCEAERIVLDARRPLDGEPLGVVLRMAAVYGSGMKGNYLRLLRALEDRRFVRIGSGRNRRTMVHEEDAATAATLAGGRGTVAGAIYNVTDGSVHTFMDIVRAICAALGRSPPRVVIPAAPVRFGALAIERACRTVGVRPLVRPALVDKLCEDLAVSGDRLRRELGFAPAWNLATGWRRTVDNLSRGK